VTQAKFLSTAAVLLAAFAPLGAEPPSKPPISARVESLGITNLTTDHVELQLSLAISSTMRLTLHGAQFEGMHLNEIPIYVAPLRVKLDLDPAAGPRSVPLGPILIYYRDLEVLDPVRRMVAEQSAALNGLAHLQIEVSPLRGIFALGPHLRVLAPLHQKVQATVPGGAAGRGTALAALAAADTAIRLGEETVNRVKERFGWTDDLTRQYGQSLFTVETRYRYNIGGQSTTRTVQGVGFRIRPDRFVTTAEMVRPWLYDPEVAQLLQSGAAVLDDSQYDVRVLPGSLTLANKQLRIVDAGSGTEKVLVTAGRKLHSVEVGRRDFDHNVAVIEFVDRRPSGTPVHATASSTREWDHAALFRTRAGSPENFEVIYVRARRVENRIELLDPTDSTAFGSPLIVPEGLIGIVQSESSGALFNHALNSMP
jgi:hypothetical protein